MNYSKEELICILRDGVTFKQAHEILEYITKLQYTITETIRTIDNMTYHGFTDENGWWFWAAGENSEFGVRGKVLKRFLERGLEDGHDTSRELACEEESEESLEENSKRGMDDTVKDYEKRFRSLKINWSETDKEKIIDALTKGV